MNIPCQRCGKQLPMNWLWHICNKCGFRVCPHCFSSRCPRCSFGQMVKN